MISLPGVSLTVKPHRLILKPFAATNTGRRLTRTPENSCLNISPPLAVIFLISAHIFCVSPCLWSDLARWGVLGCIRSCQFHKLVPWLSSVNTWCLSAGFKHTLPALYFHNCHSLSTLTCHSPICVFSLLWLRCHSLKRECVCILKCMFNSLRRSQSVNTPLSW